MQGSRSALPAATGSLKQTKHADLDRLESQITELWGHLNAATYRFLLLVAEFDRSEAYARHGLVSTAQWLNWQCGIGKVAGLIETMDGFSFWAMHAAIVLGGAVALVVFAVLFGKLLAPKVDDTATSPAAQLEPV